MVLASPTGEMGKYWRTLWASPQYKALSPITVRPIPVLRFEAGIFDVR